MSPARLIPGTAPLLLIADHASDFVPPHIELGVHPDIMATHSALDIGVGALSEALARNLDAPAIIATLSRLVVDLNRAPGSPGLIPVVADGDEVPGNAILSAEDRERRVAEYHTPYHDAVAAQLDAQPPRLIVSVHSFTPRLLSRPDELRPWHVGILYNRDDRAARIALPLLRADGIIAGDNEPYSGRDLNYTMNRHAEARGIPYLGLEIRQDELDDDNAVARWAAVLGRVILACLPKEPA
jgi:predicted N-formylglutamate amidohydrolase